MRRQKPVKLNKGVDLKRDGFSKAYLSRLALGLDLLYRWFCSLQPQPMVLWTRAGVNELLMRFVQDMFDSDVAHYLVVHAVLSFEKSYPHFHKKLSPTWHSIRTWKLRLDVSLRVPMPSQVLHSLVLCCMMLGLVWDTAAAHEWIPFGVQLWLGYEGLLRPTEMHNICIRHISLPSKAGFCYSQCALVLILNPKNKATFGRMQTAVIRNAGLIRWLEWVTAGVPLPARLNTMTVPRMRIMMHKVMQMLHMQKVGLTLASLRAGKATDLYMSGVPLDRIRFEGRWKSMHTLEHYIQEAAATTVLQAVHGHAEFLLGNLMSNI